MKDKSRPIVEIEYDQENGDYSVTKGKKHYWLILILCLIIAFAVWIYALNISDPVIEKEVILKYNVLGDCEISAEYESILIYGPTSVVEELEEIDITVNADEFSNSTSVEKKISFPKGVSPADDAQKSVMIYKAAESKK